jgi:hypothetical protein
MGLSAAELITMVVDFSGPSAIHRVGDYVRRNLATLPAAPRAWFIESDAMRSLSSKLKACSQEAK